MTTAEPGQNKVFHLGLPCERRDQALGLSSTAFPRPLSWSWPGSEVAGA